MLIQEPSSAWQRGEKTRTEVIRFMPSLLCLIEKSVLYQLHL